MGKFSSVTHSIFNQLGKMENNLVKMMFEVYFPYFLLLSLLQSIKLKGNIDWLRELNKIAVNQRKNRKEMASNQSICACPMTILFNVDGVSRCAAHTDKNRYAIDFSGIAYRRFLLRFLTLPDRY